MHGPGIDEPLVWYEGAGTVDRRQLFADERGSIVVIEGATTTKNTYDEYGVPGPGNAGRFQYTGQIWLSEVGLYHYKARAYNPELGRFMQNDPIGYADGMNMSNYADGDPVNRRDPSGLSTEEHPPELFCTGSYVKLSSCSDVAFLGCFGDCSVIREFEKTFQEANMEGGLEDVTYRFSYTIGPNGGHVFFCPPGGADRVVICGNAGGAQLYPAVTFVLPANPDPRRNGTYEVTDDGMTHIKDAHEHGGKNHDRCKGVWDLMYLNSKSNMALTLGFIVEVGVPINTGSPRYKDGATQRVGYRGDMPFSVGYTGLYYARPTDVYPSETRTNAVEAVFDFYPQAHVWRLVTAYPAAPAGAIRPAPYNC